jgi:hypothetical protein
MQQRLPQHLPTVGLLSAASLGSKSDSSGALRAVAGRPLIVRQIATLQSCGIDRFLVEVDTVPGELLQSIDDLRNRGAHIDFVRSAADLKQYLPENAQLAMLAESHYFDASVLQSVLAAAPGIATVDGRDDNARFERIDLNTRWAGFAVFDAGIAVSMEPLPDGWSMTSSLLRHAIRCGVPFHPVKQSLLQEGHILHVESEVGPQSLIRRQLSTYVASVPGVVERYLFAPLALHIAPKIWPLRNGQTAVRFLSPLLASAGFAAGFIATPPITVALVLLALFASIVSGAVDSIDGEERPPLLGRRITPVLLGGSLLTAAWSATDYGEAGLAFALLIIAFFLVADRIDIARPMRLLLRSPALVAVVLLIGATAVGLTAALQWTVLLQAGTLIAALYWPGNANNFTNQP